MRFYIPGMATRGERTKTKKKTKEGEDGEVQEDEDEDEDEDGAEEEEHNAANLFYDTLMEKAEIGEVAGDSYATFPDILHLTPRFVHEFFFLFFFFRC